MLEFAGRELAELDLWNEYGRDRELGVCKAEKLSVNPDCGFGWSPRYICNQKIRALAAGAALLRAELMGRTSPA